MEHNYNNLHLAGTYEMQRKMVHNQQKPEHIRMTTNIANLISGFLTLAIGAQVLSAVTANLKKEGIIT